MNQRVSAGSVSSHMLTFISPAKICWLCSCGTVSLHIVTALLPAVARWEFGAVLKDTIAVIVERGKGTPHSAFQPAWGLEWLTWVAAFQLTSMTQFFSHAGCVAPGMAMWVSLSVGRSTTLVQDWNISTTIWWTALKFCTDIHGAQRMDPNDFDDPLTSWIAPSSG